LLLCCLSRYHNVNIVTNSNINIDVTQTQTRTSSINTLSLTSSHNNLRHDPTCILIRLLSCSQRTIVKRAAFQVRKNWRVTNNWRVTYHHQCTQLDAMLKSPIG
jgi:hypothetical protein